MQSKMIPFNVFAVQPVEQTSDATVSVTPPDSDVEMSHDAIEAKSPLLFDFCVILSACMYQYMSVTFFFSKVQSFH